MGEMILIYTAINQIVDSAESLSQYDNLRFHVSKTQKFDVNEFFPKLSKSNIANSISSLTYILDLKNLNKFLIEKEHTNMDEVEEFFTYREDLIDQSKDEEGFVQENLLLSQVLPSMMDAKLIDSEDFTNSYFISSR